MAYIPEVLVHGDWYNNRLVFETRQEAVAYAKSLHDRWKLVENWRTSGTDQPATHRWDTGKTWPDALSPVTPEAAP